MICWGRSLTGITKNKTKQQQQKAWSHSVIHLFTTNSCVFLIQFLSRINFVKRLKADQNLLLLWTVSRQKIQTVGIQAGTHNNALIFYFFNYRQCITIDQACPGFKTFIPNCCPSEGFVKACPVGWIPTTWSASIC